MDILSIADPGSGPCFEYIEPHAQANEAITRTPAPIGSTLPEARNRAGPTSNANPANPLTMPRNTLLDGLCPPGLSQSTRTIQSVTMATSNAVTPEGTVSSAQQTPPFPMHSSRKPVIEAVVQWAAVG